MATYTVYLQNGELSVSKSMFAIWNPVGSGRVIRIYRIGLINSSVTAVAGGQIRLALYTTSACSGGTNLTIINHDSQDPSLPGSTGIIAATGSTVTNVSLFRRVFWRTDEPVINSASQDELQCIIPWNIIFDTGFDSATLQPMVLREGLGISLYDETSNTGYLTAWIEMTVGTT